MTVTYLRVPIGSAPSKINEAVLRSLVTSIGEHYGKDLNGQAKKKGVRIIQAELKTRGIKVTRNNITQLFNSCSYSKYERYGAMYANKAKVHRDYAKDILDTIIRLSNSIDPELIENIYKSYAWNRPLPETPGKMLFLETYVGINFALDDKENFISFNFKDKTSYDSLLDTHDCLRTLMGE